MTKVDCYPWAQPTEEQRAMFDQLSPEAQLEMVRQALIEGEESGEAGPLDMAAILRRAREKSGVRVPNDEG